MRKALNSVFKTGKSGNTKNTYDDESESNGSAEPIISECYSDTETSNVPSSPELKRNMKSSEKLSETSYSRQQSSSMSHLLSKQQSNSRKTSFDQNYHDNRFIENNPPLITSPPDSESEDNTVKFEPLKRSPQRTRLLSDGFKAEKSAASNQETFMIKSNESNITEKSRMAAIKSKMESNGFSAAKMMAAKEDHKQIQFGDTMMKQSSSSKAASMKMSTDNMIAEKSHFESQKEALQISQEMIHKEKKSSSHFLSTNSLMNSLLQSISPKMLTFSSEVDMEFDELSSIAKTFKSPIISQKESINMKGSMNKLENKMQNLCSQLVNDRENIDVILLMTDMLQKAWSVPQCGYDLGFNMSKIIRTTNALEALLINIGSSDNWDVAFASAQLLERCLVSDNRDYVAESSLECVVRIAKECVAKKQTEKVQVGTGILEHLFKHSESTCKEVIKLNGLETILSECRSTDETTLRHCASALTNLSLYGGPDSQESMIKLKAPVWLFPLAFHKNDNIKYYACLAITVLVANKELEAEVIKSGTLDLCEPFVSSHNPEEFAKSSTMHIHGQSKNWLVRLLPVLESKREEARTLAAFHFAMEAWIKKTQDQTEVFQEINAIEPLKRVASCPNAVASKYAAQALRMIGEEVPHKLSQQVPLWSIEDVIEWIKQIGFHSFTQEFKNSRVDGDILLELDSKMLSDDICIKNGILRKRFMRELARLKQITDYSSCDPSNLFGFLSNLGQDYTKYTYSMLKCNIDRCMLPTLTEDILLNECNIENSIHRMKMLESAKNLKNITPFVAEDKDNTDSKTLDVFISYRRSNGSQLASLLKVHLQLRGFCVFLDVEQLEAGKFDNNLLDSIRQAKNFLLVLTPNALDRCMNDPDQKDWVHREIVQALNNKCNIIPIMESFEWPQPEHLPEDIKPICHFNGITWIHDYQEACVEKLQRFLRGEVMTTTTTKQLDINAAHRYPIPHGLPPTPGTPQNLRSPSQQRRSGSVDNGRIYN